LDMLLEELGAPIVSIPLLEVPEDVLRARAAKRFTELGRPDDKPEVVEKRLNVYRDETSALVGYYEPRGYVHPLNGLGTPDEVYARLKAVV
jgi:adenylate kinase